MDVMANLELFVAAAIAGNATFGLILYSGAVVVAAIQKTVGSINADVHNDTFIRSGLPPNQVITLQAACTKNLTIDLTKSSFWLTALSPNPKLIGTERL